MAVHELACIAVRCAEEEKVNLLKRHLIGKHKVCLAKQATVYIGDVIAGVACTVNEFYLNLGMQQQQADKFAGSVSCTTNNSNFYHI